MEHSAFSLKEKLVLQYVFYDNLDIHVVYRRYTRCTSLLILDSKTMGYYIWERWAFDFSDKGSCCYSLILWQKLGWHWSSMVFLATDK